MNWSYEDIACARGATTFPGRGIYLFFLSAGGFRDGAAPAWHSPLRCNQTVTAILSTDTCREPSFFILVALWPQAVRQETIEALLPQQQLLRRRGVFFDRIVIPKQ